MKCNPQGNRVVERIVGTLKKALQKVTRSESKEWDASFQSAIYGYRNRPGPDGVAPFEVLYLAKSRFLVEPYDATPGAELLSNAWPFELAIALINVADRLVPRAIRKEGRYQIGDKVLLERGK